MFVWIGWLGMIIGSNMLATYFDTKDRSCHFWMSFFKGGVFGRGLRNSLWKIQRSFLKKKIIYIIIKIRNKKIRIKDLAESHFNFRQKSVQHSTMFGFAFSEMAKDKYFFNFDTFLFGLGSWEWSSVRISCDLFWH